MKNDFGFIFWAHLLLIIFVWASPVFFSWGIILLLILFYYLQLFIFGDCVLTRRQFKTDLRSETFYSYYLVKLGFKVNKRKLVFFLDYILPGILLVVAYVVQRIGFDPLIL